MPRLLLTLFLAAALVAPASLGATAPTLRIVHTKPFVVSGAHFRAHERVVVTLDTATRHLRRVVTDASGSFLADFGVIAFGRCAGFGLSAVGASGDRAVAKIPRPACIPARNP